MLDLMMKTGKIDQALYTTKKVIASAAFLDSIDDAYKKRVNDCITIEEIRSIYGVSGDGKPRENGESGTGTPPPPPKKPVPYGDIVNLYHTILPSLSKITKISEVLKSHIKARWGADPERRTLDWWEWYFKTAAERPFLLGNNKDGWKANFHWLIGRDNMEKVLAGYNMNSKPKEPSRHPPTYTPPPIPDDIPTPEEMDKVLRERGFRK